MDCLDDNGPILLFVDQFEEVWTLLEDSGIRQRFVQDIVNHSSRAGGPHMVLAIRADFLDRLVADPIVAPLLESVLVVVPPLSDAELRDAITRPAQAAGVALEPDLVAEMVSTAHGRPGSLPLVQYALRELFERRKGDSISRAEYDAMGGIASALSKRADDLYLELPDEVQDICPGPVPPARRCHRRGRGRQAKGHPAGAR